METATNRESAMLSLAKSDTRFEQVKIFQDWNFYDFLEVDQVTEFSDIGCAREWLCEAFDIDDLEELFNVREGGTVRDVLFREGFPIEMLDSALQRSLSEYLQSAFNRSVLDDYETDPDIQSFALGRGIKLAEPNQLIGALEQLKASLADRIGGTGSIEGKKFSLSYTPDEIKVRRTDGDKCLVATVSEGGGFEADIGGLEPEEQKALRHQAIRAIQTLTHAPVQTAVSVDQSAGDRG